MRGRDDYSVVSELANRQDLLEATVISVDAVTRTAQVNLMGLSQGVSVAIGNMDPHSLLNNRGRLLIYLARDGRAYAVAKIPNNPTDSSSPSVTLGSVGSADSKWYVRDVLGNPVFHVSIDGAGLAGSGRATQQLEFPPGQWIDGSNAPTKVITGDYPGMEYAITDSSLVAFRVPRSADLTEDLTIKFKWYINEAYAARDGEIQWGCAYSAVASDEGTVVDAAGYTGDLSSGDQDIPAVAKSMATTTIGTLTGTSLNAGDVVGLEFSRIAIDGGYNPAAKPTVVLLVVEYTMDKLGS